MVINSLFLSFILLILLLFQVVRWIKWSPSISNFSKPKSCSSVNFALYFIWRLVYDTLNLLGRSLTDLRCHLGFMVMIGSMCQCVPKQFVAWGKFWVVSGIYGVCKFGSWCLPGVYDAGRWLGQCFYTIFNIYHCHRSAPGLSSACCPGPLWVGNSFCKSQTFTSLKLWVYIGL